MMRTKPRLEGCSPLGESCWFCLKEAREVKKIVEADTGARICDECVGQCIQIMGLWATGESAEVES